MNVIKPIASLDAEPSLIGRALAPGDSDDFFILHREGQLAADPAIGAYRINLPVGCDGQHLVGIKQRFWHQRAGRTGLHALAAADTGRSAHLVIEIKDDFRLGTAAGKADHVIDLHLAAGANAQIALDTGIHVDGNGRVAAVRLGGLFCRKTRRLHTLRLGIVPKFGVRIMRGGARRLVGDQKFHHHLAGGPGAVVVAMDDHALAGCADTACGEDALALDLDHAGAAIAIRAVAVGVPIA